MILYALALFEHPHFANTWLGDGCFPCRNQRQIANCHCAALRGGLGASSSVIASAATSLINCPLSAQGTDVVFASFFEKVVGAPSFGTLHERVVVDPLNLFARRVAADTISSVDGGIKKDILKEPAVAA